MNTHRKTAIIVGVLYITATVAGILSLIGTGAIHAPDYLINVSANGNQIIIGALFSLIMAVSVAGIGVMMFPILKKQNEALALGYVGARIVEAVMFIVTVISWLLLLILSQEYVKAGAPDVSYFQTIGTLFMAERYWPTLMVAIFFSLGALMFYYLLYRSKLIPRFISVWGLIGATLVLSGALSDMFGYNLEMMIYGSLMGLNELFLGVWLIAKGFNSSAIASSSAKTDINGIK